MYVTVKCNQKRGKGDGRGRGWDSLSRLKKK